MKKQLLFIGIAAAIAFAFNAKAEACSITLLKTSSRTKTAYLAGTSISKKVQQALATQCSVKLKVMNTAERIEHEKAIFKRKIERLQGK